MTKDTKATKKKRETTTDYTDGTDDEEGDCNAKGRGGKSRVWVGVAIFFGTEFTL